MKINVLGSGYMGKQICSLFVNMGYEVIIWQNSDQNLDELMSAWYDKYQPNYPEIVDQMRAASSDPRPYEVFRLARP